MSRPTKFPLVRKTSLPMQVQAILETWVAAIWVAADTTSTLVFSSKF
jgi:hypothetical protein